MSTSDFLCNKCKIRPCPECTNLHQSVQSQPKLIRNSNTDFCINSDLDVCQISPKMWIHYLISISHFAECCENQPVTVRNANLLKSPISQW